MHDVCSCKHAKKLPSVLVNATMDSNILEVHWKIVPLIIDLEDPEETYLDIIELR